jgi:hypothetical protein
LDYLAHDVVIALAHRKCQGKAMLTAFGKNFSGMTKRKNAALIALSTRHTPTIKSFQNFGHVAVEEVRNLNPLSIMQAKYLIIAGPKEAIEILSKKVTTPKIKVKAKATKN